jgi:hypothetical protein
MQFCKSKKGQQQQQAETGISAESWDDAWCLLLRQRELGLL